MADKNDTIDVFYDMDIAQICQQFSKTRNTVDKAVAKLVKDYPDENYKYKNPETKRITIRAAGVEKLASYFRKEKHEVSTVEMELRYENEKLNAVLQEKERTIQALDKLYTEKLKLELEKSRQTFLLETQSKEQKIENLEAEKAELEEKLKNADEIKKTVDEYKRKEEEYNSKSFIYRLTHKFEL